MKRVIYIPSKDSLPRAESLAQTLNLPIQIGDSISTSDMSFNRDELQILTIPSMRIADIPEKVNSQITFHCDFTDDWKNFLNSTAIIKIENEKYKYESPPQFREVNFLRFGPRIWEPGDYLLSLIVDDEILFESRITAV